MKQIVLTNEGFNLLNTNLSEGQSQYWIGYYGLAYVPEGSALSANMTTLTPDGGDNIYNVFQGSMTTAKAGTDTDISDSAAYKLANECMYSANVMSRFRYVLDDNDNNQLVIFADNRDLGDNDTERSAGLVEYAVLRNEDESNVTVVGENSIDDGITKVDTLPLPAPLYYGGEPKPYSALGDTLDEHITHDTRSYSSSNHALALGYDVGTPGIDGEAPTDADKFDYVASRGNTFSEDISNVDDAILDKPWQLQSVSNFNRYHAPTIAEGYLQDAEPSCRNMAKVTKLFPIDHYDVISTTESNSNKVSTVKYTVKVNLTDPLTAVSNRSTPYYRVQNGALTEVSASKYRAGFKFNRVGIYAVQTALHAYNTEEDAKEDCTKHHLQMQVIGDSEPVLVAVMDLPTPIVMSEDGICDYSFDFQINFVKPDSEVIDDAAIYYNLYEDDAITWYKNQLIANASTAEAVTSLGVQMAYMRQQLNQYTGAGTSSCGIVDDDNRYALEGHTHPYMKNIVDSNGLGNGATRGIDTHPEDEPIKIYQTNGKSIVEDAQGVPHYSGEPDSEVPYIINVDDATTGLESMTLGKDSATLGTQSINMSDYGILGESTKSTLLMGGIGKSETNKYNDNHLVVKASKNSIINIPSGEISSIEGSIWTCADSTIIATGAIHNSIGIGHNDLLTESQAISPVEIRMGSAAGSMLIGRNAAYSRISQSIICGEGERGSMQFIGEYDAMSDMNAYWMDTNHLSESSIFTSRYGSVISVMSTGSCNRIGRNSVNVLSNGNFSRVLSQTSNNVLVGSHINTASPFYTPNYKMLMTVDEFNARYGIAGDYPENDPLYSLPRSGNQSELGQIVVVGTGTLNFNNKYTRDVRGVTLYITYNYDTKSWASGLTVGTSTETGIGFFNNYPYQYADLFTTGGHTKNMFMLGDYTTTGFGSENSIVMGDYSGCRKIIAKNSFINFMGDTLAYNTSNDPSPSMVFDNVWWIGAADKGPKGDIGSTTLRSHVVVNCAPYYDTDGNWSNNERYVYNRTNFERGEYRDAFVFRGSNKNVFDHAYWYGVNNARAHISFYENTAGFKFKPNDFYQPVNAPMIYTGGLALGGYGTNESNFMLLKIGTSALGNSGYQSAYSSVSGRTGSGRLLRSGAIADSQAGNYYAIRRSGNPLGPWSGSGQYTESVKNLSIAPGATFTWTVPDSIFNYRDFDTVTGMKADYGDDDYQMTLTESGINEQGRPWFKYTLPSSAPSTATKVIVYYRANPYKTSYFIKECYGEITVTSSTTGHSASLELPKKSVMVSTTDEIKANIVAVDASTQEPIPESDITVTYYDSNRRLVVAFPNIQTDQTINAKVTYNIHYTDGRVIYNYHDDALQLDHYMEDSPYAGMVLMVQDQQEMDGTLHVGLGAIPDSARDVFGCNYGVSFTCSYIGSSNIFGFESYFRGSSTKENFGVDTHRKSDPYDKKIVRTVIRDNFILDVTMQFTQSGTYDKCTIYDAALFIPLDKSYFITFAVGSFSGDYFELDSGFNVSLYAVGGALAGKPTYMHFTDATANVFGGGLQYMQIYIMTGGSSTVLGITNGGKGINELAGNLYKLTPVEFANDKTPLTGTYRDIKTYPVYCEKVYLDGTRPFETTSALQSEHH